MSKTHHGFWPCSGLIITPQQQKWTGERKEGSGQNIDELNWCIHGSAGATLVFDLFVEARAFACVCDRLAELCRAGDFEAPAGATFVALSGEGLNPESVDILGDSLAARCASTAVSRCACVSKSFEAGIIPPQTM